MEPGIDIDKDAAFIKAHQGGNGRVWVVVAQDAEGDVDRMAVFSSFEAAAKWCDDMLNMNDLECVLQVPFIVDEPEFGLKPKEKQQ